MSVPPPTVTTGGKTMKLLAGILLLVGIVDVAFVKIY